MGLKKKNMYYFDGSIGWKAHAHLKREPRVNVISPMVEKFKLQETG